MDGGSVLVAESDVMPEVRKSLERMAEFANTLRSGAYQGQGGAITAVSDTHLRAHETTANLVCRLLLEKKKLIHLSYPFFF